LIEFSIGRPQALQSAGLGRRDEARGRARYTGLLGQLVSQWPSSGCRLSRPSLSNNNRLSEWEGSLYWTVSQQRVCMHPAAQFPRQFPQCLCACLARCTLDDWMLLVYDVRRLRASQSHCLHDDESYGNRDSYVVSEASRGQLSTSCKEHLSSVHAPLD
jgi:hypothetical protein